jgi:hypothetical protein
MKKLLISLLLVSNCYAADYVTIPNTFAPKDLISASKIMANFNALGNSTKNGANKYNLAELWINGTKIINSTGVVKEDNVVKVPGEYATLSQALTAIGTTTTNIEITDDTDASGIVFPANVKSIKFKTKMLTGSGTAQFTNQFIDAPNNVQIFGDNLTVTGSISNAEIFPENFGAKGDYVADDSAPFIKAIEFARIKRLYQPNQGYTIQIRQARYLVNNLPLYARIYINGTGENSIISPYADAPVFVFNFSDGQCASGKVTNLRIHSTNPTFTNDIGFKANRIVGATSFSGMIDGWEFRNLTMFNLTNCFNLQMGNYHNVFQFNTLDNINCGFAQKGDVFVSSGQLQSNTFTSCRFSSSTSGSAMINTAYKEGSEYYSLIDNLFLRCVFEACKDGYGIYTEGNTNTFLKCYFEGNGRNINYPAMSIVGTANWSLNNKANNIIEGCHFASHYIDINLKNTTGNVIRNNFFVYNQAVPSVKESAVHFGDGVGNTDLFGNKYSGNFGNWVTKNFYSDEDINIYKYAYSYTPGVIAISPIHGYLTTGNTVYMQLNSVDEELIPIDLRLSIGNTFGGGEVITLNIGVIFTDNTTSNYSIIVTSNKAGDYTVDYGSSNIKQSTLTGTTQVYYSYGGNLLETGSVFNTWLNNTKIKGYYVNSVSNVTPSIQSAVLYSRHIIKKPSLVY